MKTTKALRPEPTGLSVNGDVRLVALQWHVQCTDHTLAELSALAAPEIPDLLKRLRVDQVSEPRFELRDGEYGEQFLEAVIDVLPAYRYRRDAS